VDQWAISFRLGGIIKLSASWPCFSQITVQMAHCQPKTCASNCDSSTSLW